MKFESKNINSIITSRNIRKNCSMDMEDVLICKVKEEQHMKVQVGLP